MDDQTLHVSMLQLTELKAPNFFPSPEPLDGFVALARVGELFALLGSAFLDNTMAFHDSRGPRSCLTVGIPSLACYHGAGVVMVEYVESSFVWSDWT